MIQEVLLDCLSLGLASTWTNIFLRRDSSIGLPSNALSYAPYVCMLEIDILYLISNWVYRLVKSDYRVKLITINFSDILNNRYTNL